jgi:hypothetical protein
VGLHGGAEGAPLATGADELVDEVLLLGLGAVHHAGAQHERAGDGAEDGALGLELALSVHVQRPGLVLLPEGPALAIEDIVARVVDEGRARALGHAPEEERGVAVEREGLVRVILAVVHVADGRRAEDPVGLDEVDGVLHRVRVADV